MYYMYSAQVKDSHLNIQTTLGNKTNVEICFPMDTTMIYANPNSGQLSTRWMEPRDGTVMLVQRGGATSLVFKTLGYQSKGIARVVYWSKPRVAKPRLLSLVLANPAKMQRVSSSNAVVGCAIKLMRSSLLSPTSIPMRSCFHMHIWWLSKNREY